MIGRRIGVSPNMSATTDLQLQEVPVSKQHTTPYRSIRTRIGPECWLRLVRLIGRVSSCALVPTPVR
jgi:hypothetical protein